MGDVNGGNMPEERESRAASALWPGTLLAGRYSVDKLLGGAALGLTYAGTDEKTGRGCAIREYFPRGLAERVPGAATVSARDTALCEAFVTGADAFYEEADKLLDAVGSANVVDVRDRFFENGTAYAVTDRYDGMSLRAYLRMSGRRLSDGELCCLLENLADGLLVVHSLSMLHGDIRPDNVFLQSDGPAKLIDFGAARRAAFGDDFPVRADAEEPWRDIRLLGETLFFARTGTRPPSAERVTEADMEKLPLPFRACFFSMLTNDSRVRFSSVFDLEHAVNGIDIPRVRPVINRALYDRYSQTLAERAAKKRKNLILAAVFGALTLLAAGVLVYLLATR